MKRRTKVLVVDDDPIVLEVARTRLTRAGYDVVTREDALGTSTAVAQESPDVVLLDIAMPGISGEALARLIAQNQKKHPVSVIFHSSREQADLDKLAEDCQALGSIQKTSSASMFQIQFERLLLQRKRRDATSSPDLPAITAAEAESIASSRKR
jgi:DNA-binding NtrC family response regulator